MMNRLGIMLPNGPGEFESALDLGFGVYLVMHTGGESVAQVQRVKDRYPEARILLRRPGGIGGQPQDIINDLQAWYPLYRNVAPDIVDWIPWNEADRREEGGFSAEYIADFARRFVPLGRTACPGICLHWPAPAHEPFYAEIGKWKDAAALFDCLDGHWYVDAEGINRLGQFFHSHFPGRGWFVTEYSSRGLNAPPPRLGVTEDARAACHNAYLWPNCGGIVFFIWRWPGAEPGGEIEEIANDPETQAGIRQALTEVSEEPTPQVLGPLPTISDEGRQPVRAAVRARAVRPPLVVAPGQDFNDCFAASAESASALLPGFPTLRQFKAVLRQMVPSWNDATQTPPLPAGWEVFGRFGFRAERVETNLARWAAIVADTSKSNPIIWVNWFAANGLPLFHAMVINRVHGDRLRLFDPRWGHDHEMIYRQFVNGVGRIVLHPQQMIYYFVPSRPVRPVFPPGEQRELPPRLRDAVRLHLDLLWATSEQFFRAQSPLLTEGGQFLRDHIAYVKWRFALQSDLPREPKAFQVPTLLQQELKDALAGQLRLLQGDAEDLFAAGLADEGRFLRERIDALRAKFAIE